MHLPSTVRRSAVAAALEELRAFREVGEAFVFRNATFYVTGHSQTEVEDGRRETIPMLCAEFKDHTGVWRAKRFVPEMLPMLIRDNPEPDPAIAYDSTATVRPETARAVLLDDVTRGNVHEIKQHAREVMDAHDAAENAADEDAREEADAAEVAARETEARLAAEAATLFGDSRHPDELPADLTGSGQEMVAAGPVRTTDPARDAFLSARTANPDPTEREGDREPQTVTRVVEPDGGRREATGAQAPATGTERAATAPTGREGPPGSGGPPGAAQGRTGEDVADVDNRSLSDGAGRAGNDVERRYTEADMLRAFTAGMNWSVNLTARVIPKSARGFTRYMQRHYDVTPRASRLDDL